MVDLGNKGVDTLVAESPNGLTAVRLFGESHTAAELIAACGCENLACSKVVSTMSTLHNIHLSRALLSPFLYCIYIIPYFDRFVKR